MGGLGATGRGGLYFLKLSLFGSSRFPSSTLLPFFFWVRLLTPNSRKKGTLIIKGLLGNLVLIAGIEGPVPAYPLSP